MIQDIASRIDIVDVIGETVTLTRKGGRYWGLCPFHGEKTASFCVNRDRQMFYCFGCHEGGNVYSFLMKTQNLTFQEVIRMLADRSGVKLPEYENRSRNTETEEFRRLHEVAASHYRSNLKGNDGAQARAYLKERGVTDESIERFGLGFATDSWDDLTHTLKTAGFSPQQLLKSGLVRTSEKTGNLFDLLRKRVIFPIYQYDKSVIAFGGRTMDKGVEPKYINSPETMIFSKRKNLYGLPLARASMRSSGTAFLVEGYMDCLKLSQAGITNVVASLGTAFTAEQASLLHRYVDRAVLLYDGDEAGQRETVRASGLLQAEGIKAEVLSLPDNMDPDEYVSAYGKSGFEEYLAENRHSVIEFKLYRWLEKQGGKSGRREAVSELLREIRDDFKRLPDEVERDYHIDLLMRKLNLEESTIRREMNSRGRGLNPGRTMASAGNKEVRIQRGAEITMTERVVAGMLKDPACYRKIYTTLGLNVFREEDDRNLLRLWAELKNKKPEATLRELQYEALEKGLESRLSRMEMIIENGMAADLIRISDYIVRVKEARFKNHCEGLKIKIEQMEKNGTDFASMKEMIEKIGLVRAQIQGEK